MIKWYYSKFKTTIHKWFTLPTEFMGGQYANRHSNEIFTGIKKYDTRRNR